VDEVSFHMNRRTAQINTELLCVINPPVMVFAVGQQLHCIFFFIFLFVLLCLCGFDSIADCGLSPTSDTVITWIIIAVSDCSYVPG